MKSQEYKSIFSKQRFLFVSISILLFICSCESEKYRISDSNKSQFDSDLVQGLVNVLDEKQTDSLVKIPEQQGDYENLKLLATKKVDFVLANNDVTTSSNFSRNPINDDGVRIATVLYPEVLFILYRDSVRYTSFKDLLYKKKVCFGKKTKVLDFNPLVQGNKTQNSQIKNYNSKNIMYALMKHFNVYQNLKDVHDFTIDSIAIAYDQKTYSYRWYQEDSTQQPDVLCLLSRPNDPDLHQILRDTTLKIFSFDDIDTPLETSRVGGFTIYNPAYYPFVVPKENFGFIPKNAITTIAVDRLLLTRKDVHDNFIYKLASIIIGKSVPKNNILTNNALVKKLFQLRIDNYKENLSFSLHQGTKKYYKDLEDERTLLERYGRTIGSLASALLAAFAALYRWRGNQRYKRLKKYYELAIDVEQQLSDHWHDVQFLEDSLDKMLKIKEEVYDLLSVGKLQININFTAFQDMVGAIIQQITTARQNAILYELEKTNDRQIEALIKIEKSVQASNTSSSSQAEEGSSET